MTSSSDYDPDNPPPEPPLGTWVRDRHGSVSQHRTYQEVTGWGAPGIMPFGKWEAMWAARGPLEECGPWGRPLETADDRANKWEEAAIEAHKEMAFHRERADKYKAQLKAQREATALAWSAFLAVSLDTRLEDGTPLLDFIMDSNPTLRERFREVLGI